MRSTLRYRGLSVPVGDIELRLLRVFAAIVHHGGFSAAQASLGMTQATISTHMRHLEGRLGVRLCERGRGGFRLTEEGARVHEAVLDLFGSIERFQNAAASARGELSGSLSFGTVDAMVSNRLLNLQGALAAFHRAAPRVWLQIEVAAPQVLHQGLLSGSYQVVLMPATNIATSHVRARSIFSETQKLYCAQGHPLFNVPDREITVPLLEAQPFAGRTYMTDAPICGVNFAWAAATPHMEGTLLLLLSGAYIGFLPDHYAEDSVRKGLLRILAADRMTFDDEFQIAYPQARATRAAEALTQAIVDSVQAAAGRKESAPP